MMFGCWSRVMPAAAPQAPAGAKRPTVGLPRSPQPPTRLPSVSRAHAVDFKLSSCAPFPASVSPLFNVNEFSIFQ
jgi:hypothetical protein